jgi:hypothetical protein
MTGVEQTQQIALHPDSDWFLTSLVEFVNNRGSELPITLQVGGFLVSGLLVSYEKYFESVGLDFAKLFGAENMPKSRANGEASEQQPPSFIHLREAHIFHSASQPIPASTSVWWRGRISEVSGFFLGVLSTGN